MTRTNYDKHVRKHTHTDTHTYMFAIIEASIEFIL